MRQRLNLGLLALLVLQFVVLGFRFMGDDELKQSANKGLFFKELNVDAVTKISISGPKSSHNDAQNVGYVEKEGEHWQVPGLQNYPADAQKVKATLGELAGLEIATLVSTTEHHHRDLKVSDEAYERKVSLELDSKTIEFYVGTAGRANSVHVRHAKDAQVFSVRDFSAWQLSNDNDAYIDKVFLAVDKNKIVQIQINNPKGDLTLAKRSDDSWLSTGQADVDRVFDGNNLQDLLNALSRVNLRQVLGQDHEKVKDHLGEQVASIKIGLGSPATDKSLYAKAADADAEAEATDKDGEKPDSETAPLEVEFTQSLNIWTKKDEKDVYILKKEDSTFWVDAGQWTVRGLLDASIDNLIKKAESADAEDTQAH
jgi:hypothetical protein